MTQMRGETDVRVPDTADRYYALGSRNDGRTAGHFRCPA